MMAKQEIHGILRDVIKINQEYDEKCDRTNGGLYHDEVKFWWYTKGGWYQFQDFAELIKI